MRLTLHLTLVLALVTPAVAAPTPSPQGQVTFIFDLADALVGGDGSLPGTGAPGEVSPPPGGSFRPLSARSVDGVFVMDPDAPTRIASTGLRFDFSPLLGTGQRNRWPANGPAGIVSDPSGQSGNPDFTGDPDHSLLEMHAVVGVTFDLDAVRAAFQNQVTVTQFDAIAGGSTPGTTSYWVLVDGARRDFAPMVGIGRRRATVPLGPEDRFLTLAVGDGNTGNINWAHGYFGDPFLTLQGKEASKPASNPIPASGSVRMLAWQPLSWDRQVGVTRYEVAYWEDAPGSTRSTGETTAPQFFPQTYLKHATAYRWQVVTHTVSGSTYPGPEWTFTTKARNQTVPEPPYDISPTAQAQRRASYDVDGILSLTGPDTPLSADQAISFFGDSITDNTMYQHGIVHALASSPHTKGLGVRIDNRGINGAKVEDLVRGTRRYGQGGGVPNPLPFDQQIDQDRPDVAVIFVGVNETNDYPAKKYPGGDVSYGSPPTSDADYRRHLQSMLDHCAQRDVKVVLVTPAVNGEKPDGSNPFDGRLDAYAAVCRELAERPEVAFVDLRTAFLDYLRNHNYRLEPDGTVTFPASRGILTGDGVHFSQRGKELGAQLVAAGIARVLASR